MWAVAVCIAHQRLRPSVLAQLMLCWRRGRLVGCWLALHEGCLLGLPLVLTSSCRMRFCGFVRAVFLFGGGASATRTAEVHVDLVWGGLEWWVGATLLASFSPAWPPALQVQKVLFRLMRRSGTQKCAQGVGVPSCVSHSARHIWCCCSHWVCGYPLSAVGVGTCVRESLQFGGCERVQCVLSGVVLLPYACFCFALVAQHLLGGHCLTST
jgi:hypothetical protein